MQHTQTSGIKHLELDRNEEFGLLFIGSEVTYPILVSVNLLVNTPNKLPIPLTPVDITSLPSTSGQAQDPENVLELNITDSDISTIGTTKSIANENNQS